MTTPPVLWLTGLLLCTIPAAATPSTGEADVLVACDETQPCFLEGLDLDDDQAREARELLEAARKRQDDLRDDTYQRIRDLLTPEQSRHLDDSRTVILMQRARALRHQAGQLQRRASRLKDSP